MMFQRHTTVIPGWDDLYDVCKHPNKGNHGIHADEVIHRVVTELADGRKIALTMGIVTDDYPATIPESHFRHGKIHTRRGMGVELHVQALAGDDAGKMPCECLDGAVCGTTTIWLADSDAIWDSVQPCEFRVANEALWRVLEERLADSIAKGHGYPDPDERDIDTLIAIIEAKTKTTVTLDRARESMNGKTTMAWCYETDRGRWLSRPTLRELVNEMYRTLVVEP